MTQVTSEQIVDSTVDSTPVGFTSPSTGAFTSVTVVSDLNACGVLQVNTSAATSVTPGASDNSTKVATTAWSLLGFAALLATNGYIKFPSWLGGIIFQWGSAIPGDVGDGDPGNVVIFPLPFPNNCYAVQATMNNNIGTSVRSLTCYAQSTTEFTLGASGSSSTATWMAVGH